MNKSLIFFSLYIYAVAPIRLGQLEWGQLLYRERLKTKLKQISSSKVLIKQFLGDKFYSYNFLHLNFIVFNLCTSLGERKPVTILISHLKKGIFHFISKHDESGFDLESDACVCLVAFSSGMQLAVSNCGRELSSAISLISLPVIILSNYFSLQF